jgi:hypothetical protein
MVPVHLKILLRIGLLLCKRSLEEEMRMENVLLYTVLQDSEGDRAFSDDFLKQMIGHLFLLPLLLLKMV